MELILYLRVLIRELYYFNEYEQPLEITGVDSRRYSHNWVQYVHASHCGHMFHTRNQVFHLFYTGHENAEYGNNVVVTNGATCKTEQPTPHRL